MLLRRMKNHCFRCGSVMESKGFRVLSSGIKKRLYRCSSCRGQQHNQRDSLAKLDDINDLSVVVKKRFAPRCKDVSYYEDTKSDYFQILSSFSNARASFFDISSEKQLLNDECQKSCNNSDCDCDSVFFHVLGCVIHTPHKFNGGILILDGSFCELHDAYFGH